MAGRKAGTRREPVFGVSAGPASDIRVSREDRPAPGSAAGGHGGKTSGNPARREPTAPSRPRRPGRKGKSRSKGRLRRFLSRSIYWGAVASLWLVIAGIAAVFWVGFHLPPIQSLEIPPRPPSVQIVGADGTALATRGEMGGVAVPLRELPPHLPLAFIAIEDRRFNYHFGFDPIGLARAAAANLANLGVAQGGSTLTQQLAKNLFLNQERTYNRKIQELVLALWLEHRYTKPQILELYLNRVYFGAGAYGVEAAAQRYFDKSARQVTLAEAAMLAGLVKSPSRLAPHRNRAAAERRAEVVLAAMVDTGAITQTQARTALTAPAKAVRNVTGGSINYVADWIMDVINDVVGHVDQDLVVETTIEPVLQAAAERALAGELAQNGEKFRVGQGAMVAMTPEGAVVAMIGGRNYSDSQFNRAVSARRQPGSAFKPFVYLTALERGLAPDSVREDKPISLKGWKPSNYTREYFGPVTLTQALAMSLNTVAVRLTLEVGPTAVARTAYRMGIASRLDPNPSLALGTSEVSVIELVSAYAPFANGGMAVAPHAVMRVTGANGKVLYQRKPQHLGRIVDGRYVAMMNAMMRETLLSGTARKADLGAWAAAGKTGTSQDFRDAWFVAYTSHLVTGVWLGNDDSSPMRRATGSGLPVDIWRNFMKAAHQGIPVAGLPGLNGGTPVSSSMHANALPGRGGDMVDQPPGLIPPERSATAMPVRAAPPARGNGTSNLDNWLVDRLFGRQ